MAFRDAFRAGLTALVLGLAPAAATAQTEIPKSFSPVTADYDYERREVMIPMRDGVKLHTVIVIPKAGPKPAPIILSRTPYGADKPTSQSPSPFAAMALPLADEPLLREGYIRVYQDVRGRYGSEGDYVMTLPVRGPLNRRKVDQTTDTHDTIAWLVKNVPGNNGRGHPDRRGYNPHRAATRRLGASSWPRSGCSPARWACPRHRECG